MRVLVCGSRHFNDINLMSQILTEQDEDQEITLLINGGAKGADTLAKDWAYRHGKDYVTYPADWDKYGKGAGPIRNKQMLDEGKPDLVVAFIGPGSKGTRNMVDQAKKYGFPVKEIEIWT